MEKKRKFKSFIEEFYSKFAKINASNDNAIFSFIKLTKRK